ncbi:MAG: hypothetical protein KPEEDBHJ_01941 [Anaerolineales bacterium]|nr:hypothetical protein [Anaerolineales bacterium]
MKACVNAMSNNQRYPIEHETFARLGRELASTADAESAAQIILDAADRLIGWEACYLILYDPSKGKSPRPLLAIDTINGQRLVQRDVSPQSPSKNMLKAIAEDGFVSLYAGFFELDASQTFGDRTRRTLSQMFMPVVSGSRTVGVMSIQSYKRNAYNKEHLEVLRALASHCAGALERIWAQEALGEFARRLQALHSAVATINSSLDVEHVCRVTYEAVRTVMPCNDFVIDGYDTESDEVMPYFAIEEPGRRMFPSRYKADHGLAGEILRTGKPILFNNKQEMEASGIRMEFFGSNEVDPAHSMLSVPMILHGRIYGMVSAQAYAENAYDADDLSLLETLASHAAIAIENARLFHSVQQMARTDPLTKVLNRRRFFEMAECEFDKTEISGSPLSVIMLDVDDFKQFNDRHGHKVGDAVLILTAETCRDCLRADDILGRMGGEEFAVALPDTRLETARTIAERLRRAVEHTDLSNFIQMEGVAVPSVTVSVGVTEFEATVKSLDVLLDRADKAMYAAKNGGRNQVRVWEGEG